MNRQDKPQPRRRVFSSVWRRGLLILAVMSLVALMTRSALLHAENAPATALQIDAGREDKNSHEDAGLVLAAADSAAKDSTAKAVTSTKVDNPEQKTAGKMVQKAPVAAKAYNISDAKKLAVESTWLDRLMSLVGLAVLLGIAVLLSRKRSAISWRLVGWGLGLQMLFAVLIIRTSIGEAFFDAMKRMFMALLSFTQAGSSFLFGNLAAGNNVPVGIGSGPFAPIQASANWASVGASFAFGVLPTIIFFSSLMTVLYHLGLMQKVVQAFAWIMQRTMGSSGAESLSAAGNIFVGQTEAPLLIKPFINDMTKSELMAVMTGGFATVAGGVMAAYVGMLVGFFPDIAGHLLSASVMSAPAALVVAKIIWPEDGQPKTSGQITVPVASTDANVIDAAARGAGEGLSLALNVGAMLLAFIALVAMINALVGLPASWHNSSVWAEVQLALHSKGLAVSASCLKADGASALKSCIDGVNSSGVLAQHFSAWTPWSLEMILGYLLAPLAWLMGVPWSDAAQVGSLLGVKTILNEFVAYQQLAGMLAQGSIQSPRSVVIATYALCGFANFGSIAIQIGGIGGIAPARRQDLARLGLLAMVGGTLAAYMTATIAGLLL